MFGSPAQFNKVLSTIWRKNMETLKEEAMNAIGKLPETANVDEIMYRIYVIDKIKKGQEAVKEGKSISVESLKEEMKSW
jgi:hypothetical protein